MEDGEICTETSLSDGQGQEFEAKSPGFHGRAPRNCISFNFLDQTIIMHSLERLFTDDYRTSETLGWFILRHDRITVIMRFCKDFKDKESATDNEITHQTSTVEGAGCYFWHDNGNAFHTIIQSVSTVIKDFSKV